MLKGEADPATPLQAQEAPTGPSGASPSCLLPTEATEQRLSAWPDPLLPAGAGLWLMVEAFHCQLKGPVVVDQKTLVELQGFQAVSGDVGPGQGLASLGIHCKCLRTRRGRSMGAGSRVGPL